MITNKDLLEDSLIIQDFFDKYVLDHGIVNILERIIIANSHLRENIQDTPDISISDIAYIHSIPVLNNGIGKLICKFKKSINK